MFKVRQPLFEMSGEIGSESPSVVADQTPNEGQGSDEGNAPASTENDVSKQSSFAKRLNEELAKKEKEWEAKHSEKYKDHDVYKKSAEYFAKINGVNDVMSLKERIEMEELQEAAEKQQVPVEVLKRLQELEAKASKGEELEKTINEQKQQQTYWDSMNKFAESKEIDSKALNQFMVENQMTYDPNNMDKSFELAFKAMKYDEVAMEKAEAEKAGMKKVIQAKSSIPNVTGNKSNGQVTAPPPKTFADAQARARQRFGI